MRRFPRIYSKFPLNFSPAGCEPCQKHYPKSNMQAARQIPVEITTTQNTRTQVNLTLKELSSDERRRNAIKAGLICWALAVGALITFIPVVHLVLAAILLLAGPFVAWRRYGLTRQIAGGTVVCPVCSNSIHYDARFVKWPMTLTCPQCRNLLEMRPTGAGPDSA